MIPTQIRSICYFELKKAVRDRVLHVLAGIGIVTMVFAVFLGNVSIGGNNRVVVSMSFWVLGILGLVGAVYLGAQLIREEKKDKILYLIFSRPIKRHVYLYGKCISLVFTLFFLYIPLVLFMIVLMYLLSLPLNSGFFIAWAFIFGEWIILCSFSLFFASFTSPLLHVVFTSGIYFFGHWSGDLIILNKNLTSDFLKICIQTLYYSIPNLEVINFRSFALYDKVITSSMIFQGVGLIILWTCTAMIAAQIIFLRRTLQ
ncbi:MAG: hypothetical protein V1793_21050 [Pseudomonadota bacterium]